MVRVAITSLLALAVTAHALTVDSAGAGNVGNGNGKQFVGGECLSSADCAPDRCCAVLGNQGICSAISAQKDQNKGGCGFGDGGATQNNNSNGGAGQNNNNNGGATQNNNNGGAGQNEDGTGKDRVGAGNGDQTVPNQCASDADCKTGCCAQLNGGKGVCSGPGVAEDSGKSGCGFVDPNFGGGAAGNNGNNANAGNGNNGNTNGQKGNKNQGGQGNGQNGQNGQGGQGGAGGAGGQGSRN